MPVLFEEKRIFFSSAEKEAPEIAVVARNCSIVYCFEGRPGGAARTAAAVQEKTRLARPNRRREIIRRSFITGAILSFSSGGMRWLSSLNRLPRTTHRSHRRS